MKAHGGKHPLLEWPANILGRCSSTEKNHRENEESSNIVGTQ
jgi:hypothetical protein